MHRLSLQINAAMLLTHLERRLVGAQCTSFVPQQHSHVQSYSSNSVDGLQQGEWLWQVIFDRGTVVDHCIDTFVYIYHWLCLRYTDVQGSSELSLLVVFNLRFDLPRCFLARDTE